MTKIVYADEQYLPSLHRALDNVAREQIYIEMIEAPSFDKTLEFQKNLIANQWPSFYAIENEVVVGWADITRSTNPRIAHRGFLGMGLITSFRGKGLGTQLLEHALAHAQSVGIEKVELLVYSTNTPAIGLYKKFGFNEIGFIRHFRKLNGQYFDCVEMEKFL